MVCKHLLALTAALIGHVSAFRNPIISGVNADPSAIRVGNDYFLASSSFEYFPGIPIYHSTNLVDWTIVSHGLTAENAIYDRQLLTTGGIFAPTLRHHNGTFYLITNYADTFNPSDQRPFLITTSDIFSGSWSQPLYFDQTGIDPDLFFDDDGTVYLSTALPEFGPKGGNSTIWQSKVDVKTGHSLTQPELIYRSSLPLAIRWSEGPHVYKINGTYYLSVAEGGTEVLHRQTIHRSTTPSGPWTLSPLGPLVFNSRDPTAPIQQTGHADLVTRPDGKWYAVFLAVRPQLPANINGTYQLGRETFLSPVTWSAEGWPLANDGKLITFDMPDADLPVSNASTTWHDDFTSTSLDPTRWETRGTPYGAWHRVANASLLLRGTPRTLSAFDGTALILTKQDALYYNFSADVSFAPSLPTHEAGVVAWVNDEFHNSIALVLCANQTEAVCVKTATIAQGEGVDGNVTTKYTRVPDAGVSGGRACLRLHVRATPEEYRLGYSVTGGEVTWLAAFSARWMAPRSGGRISWQGARMGMYASGNGVPMLVEAGFRDVEVVRGDGA